LRQRFQRAMGQYESLLATQDQREAAGADSNLLAAAGQVRAWQRAVLQGAPEAQCEALHAAAEAFVAGVPRWPLKGAAQRLRQALALTAPAELLAAAGDEPARERALRQLCVRAEILGGSTTPPEDLALRRELELQMLRQGLGQARRVEARDWDAMRLEWLGIVAVEPALHDALERRFVRGCGRARPA
jgi:hypothetical protein